MVTGKKDVVTYQYASISKDKLNSFSQNKDNGEIVFFHVTTLLDLALNDLPARLHFSVVVVPDAYVHKLFPESFPNVSQNFIDGCIVGDIASKNWKLKCGDSFSFLPQTLSSKMKFHPQVSGGNKPNFKISYTLPENTIWSFARCSIFIPESVFIRETKSTCPINCVVFWSSKNNLYKSSIEWANNNHLFIYSNRHIFLYGNIVVILVLFIFACVIKCFVAMGITLVDDNRRDIQLLLSLGTSVFFLRLLLFLVIFPYLIVVISIAIIIYKLLNYALNHLVIISSGLGFDFYYYQDFYVPNIILFISLFLTLMLLLVTIIKRLAVK
jgi:hypothetical protein